MSRVRMKQGKLAFCFSRCSSRIQFVAFYLGKLVLHQSWRLFLDQLNSIALQPGITTFYTVVVNKRPTTICCNYL